MSYAATNLVWLDLEMTGLDPDRDQILEIATVVTDKNLHELATGPVLAIHRSENVLNAMDSWNTKQHTGSGLWDRVLASDVTLAQAEEETLDFLTQYVPSRTSPMCGNSICQDRRFLYRLMPKLEAFFHYRNLDVSSLKELARRWSPKLCDSFCKEARHLALEDIRDSIDELKHYRRHMGPFAGQTSNQA